MNAVAGTMTEDYVGLMDELEGLLRKQIELAHQGDAVGERFGLLTARAGSVVERLSRLGGAGHGEQRLRFERLRELYETLSLVLVAEKADVCEELGRIRRGRRTIGVYRANT